MSKPSTADLFSAPVRKQRHLTPREAEEALSRARNAALQAPFAQLQAGRATFKKNDVLLFEHANPVQAAQFFLSQISHNMVFATPISTAEMSHELASHIRMLAGDDRMDLETVEAAAEKIIDLLRNRQGDYRAFQETFRNPATLEEVTYEFALLAVDSVRSGSDDLNVFKLTREGVKLLHVNWSPNEDFNMISLIVENLVRNGRYTEAHSHVVQCRDKSVENESQIGDILRALNQFSFQPDFQKEMSALIAAAQVQAESFGATYRDFQRLFEATESAGLSPEQKEDIALIRIELRHIHDIQSRLSYMLSDCVKRQMALLANRMDSTSISTAVPDVQEDLADRC